MALTIGGLILECRAIVNDQVLVQGTYRYTDTEFVNAFNDALLQARAKRPDIFLSMGLRNSVPQYAMPADQGTPFPLDPIYYSPFIWYLCGRAELKEDTFSDDSRAVTLMNKFVAQLTQVAS